MTLTPEQIAEGWKLHDGSDVCPIKDNRTVFEAIQGTGRIGPASMARQFIWEVFSAYRIIEAHGADAELARPTPFPRDYSELVFDADGWSQTIIVDGKRPDWLRDDDRCCAATQRASFRWLESSCVSDDLAIRVRRREPKRETVRGYILSHYINERPEVVFDLIDGKPDLSTLKIAEDVL